MKTLISLSLLLLLCSGLNAEALRLSEPVQIDNTSETFGAPINELPPFSQISDLLSQPDQYNKTTLAVSANVSKVCQSKGCFFIAQQGNDLIRVAFKDYGFFVPTDIANREVTIVGELSKREIDEAEAQHLSADLGEKGSIQSGMLYEVIATSVRVPLANSLSD